METSLKSSFAQKFSCCPKNLSCPNFGGAAAPLAPPGPYAYGRHKNIYLPGFAKRYLQDFLVTVSFEACSVLEFVCFVLFFIFLVQKSPNKLQ